MLSDNTNFNFMMNQTIINSINEQVKLEMDSANLYLSMSSAMHEAGLTGAAHWLRVQYREENDHALRLIDYLIARDAKIVVPAVDAPQYDAKTACEMFELALEHERLVTRSVNNMVALAKQEGDYATEIFLQWYVTEQVEEEQNVTDIIHKLRLARDCGQSLLLIDAELAKRAYVPQASQG